MAHVTEIDVKDAAGVTRTVDTLDAIAALVGEVQASPTSNTLLDRQKTLATLQGAVNETAPASDTASSGLNGRLQRIAQRLTSLIALLPTAIGPTAKAAALSVTLASDDPSVALSGAVNETAPASDTASSGQNGRLQRIAQRLTSLIALFPAAIGPTAKAGALSVTLATDDPSVALSGAVNETAPASDTASSGQNGRLQRVAQRLTSLIALLPAAIGPTAKAGALSTTTATDDPLISQTGIVTETAPATDTASSGLNGRLQRIAQRLTTLIGQVSGAETTVTPAAVTLVANTAKALLAANSNRIRVVIFNPLATTLFVRKALLATSAATVAAGHYDFVVPAGGTWVSDPKEWTGDLNGICVTAGDVNVSESV
jgi:hypothetical protein